MKLAIFAYTRRGCETAEKIKDCFPGSELRAFTADRLSNGSFRPLGQSPGDIYSENFNWADALIFVSSCGIAVRSVSPFLQSKATDPAVICIDESVNFVIPLLSGHIGGANRLAGEIARQTGAVPVITTATDVNGRFSVDEWAVRNGYIIGSLETAKVISASILERDIPICSGLPILTDYPDGTYPGNEGEIGIYIGWETERPFPRTLSIIPPVLHLGIGCRLGTSAGDISRAVSLTCAENSIDPRAIKCAASINLKSEEPGLLDCCAEKGLPISFYTSDELMSVPGDFSSSDFVESVTGADNVCERAAMIGADRLIVRKTAINGVTTAIAAERTEVRFD